MKIVKYVPECCQGENPTFSGEIEYRSPTFDDKFEIMDECGIEIDKGGVNLSTINNMKMIRQMVKTSGRFYVSVSLKRLSDGLELTKYEDLQDEPEAHEILMEVAVQLMSGFKVGKV